MNQSSKFLLSVAAFACIWIPSAAKNYTLASPGNTLSVEVSDDGGRLSYSIAAGTRTLVEPSSLTFDIVGRKSAMQIKSTRRRSNVSETVDAIHYRQKQFTVCYNELYLRLNENRSITFRAYPDGIAYRFSTTSTDSLIINNEGFDINLPDDLRVWLPYSTNREKPFAMAFQATYATDSISKAQAFPAFMPVTVDYGDGLKMTVTESDLESFPGTYLTPDPAERSLRSEHAKYPKAYDVYRWRYQTYVTDTEDYIARVAGSRNYPWRVFAVTTDDRQMPVNNLVYALASPSRVPASMKIPSGKAAWDWWNDWGLKCVPFTAGINNDTYKYFIDFASENGLEFIVIDEGWFDSKKNDMLTTVPDLDLPMLVGYGRKKGVGIILWTVFNILDDNLKEICKTYKDMGIVGFKVDFLDRDDQTAVEMAYRIADECARNGLVLDYHGFYKPTGLNRTYPNVVNFEGVFGMEEAKWSDPSVDMPRYDVTFPYIRMLAGPVDFTPGAMLNASKKDWKAIYSKPMSMGTRCHQLGTYIVYDSPFTMLADTPTNYLAEEESLRFLSSLPVDFDETEILQGRMGESIVTMRRAGGSYFVGGLTDWTPRDIELSFGFLPEGRRFRAVIMKDGLNADRTAEDYLTDTVTVDSATKMPLRMASGGGFAMRIDPLPDAHGSVTAVPENMRRKIDDFYKKYIESDGFYVVSSENVSDEALGLAADIAGHMLLKRPDIKKHMVDRGCHLLIIGKDECTCDIPEYKHVCGTDTASIAYWNRRARGFGGAPEDELSSGCGEENLLALPGDKYEGENILIHEFAHLIHTIGIAETDPGFDARLQALLESAKAKGLWENTYALSNKEEYFAEAVQSFFNCNRYAEPTDGVHNSVNRRAKLKAYDPDMYQLLTEYFYETDIPIKNKIHK